VAEFLHSKFHKTIVYKFVQHYAHTSIVKAILIQSSYYSGFGDGHHHHHNLTGEICAVLDRLVDSDWIDMHGKQNTVKFLITSHVGIKESGAILKSFSYYLNLLETFHVVTINDGTESKNSSARKNFMLHT
jgi:hypothetical protein